MAGEFYYDNEDVPSVPYYYDATDDCLHADGVYIPFHYREDEITNVLIYESLCRLEILLKDFFQKKYGITLYEYD